MKKLYFKRGLFSKKPRNIIREYFYNRATLINNNNIVGNNLNEIKENEIKNENKEIENKK